MKECNYFRFGYCGLTWEKSGFLCSCSDCDEFMNPENINMKITLTLELIEEIQDSEKDMKFT
jgi:hypothetical protein